MNRQLDPSPNSVTSTSVSQGSKEKEGKMPLEGMLENICGHFFFNVTIIGECYWWPRAALSIPQCSGQSNITKNSSTQSCPLKKH